MHRADFSIKLFMTLFICFLMGVATFSETQAGRLSDLVKQPPQLYLPSQIIPGKASVFTLKAKAGKQFRLILSSSPTGLELPNGISLPVGKPSIEEQGTIPLSGVREITINIPESLADLASKQFVAAIVWSDIDQSDMEMAQVIEHTGVTAMVNQVIVGAESDQGSTLIVPGDPGMTNIMRSLSIMNEVGNDPRKRELIDDGKINRQRLIDRTLHVSPASSGLP